MEYLIDLMVTPSTWVALLTLIAMEVVLGIDNLIFISILTNKLPKAMRKRVTRIGISLAMVMRLGLLTTLTTLMAFTEPVLTLFGQEFSWRDLILIAGGLFLVWKATKEIHQHVDVDGHETSKVSAAETFGAVIVQIIVIDLVFSVDSIITAVGMTEHIPIMIVAVIASVACMMLAAIPLANFVSRNPSVLMLALGFLLLIGTTLIAEGFGVHMPKGYIYGAMAFAAAVEGLNLLVRRARSAK